MTLRRQSGLTLVELLVALAVTSFLIVGAVQVYTQSRQAFMLNESLARVRETAQFALDTIESDLRLAGNWGRTNRARAIDGRAVAGNANPLNIAGVPAECGDDWVLGLDLIVDGADNVYTLPCPPGTASSRVGVQPGTDTFTVRRTTAEPAPPEAGRIQVQSTRIDGRLFADGIVPTGFAPDKSSTHTLLVHSYYVADDSSLAPGIPTLRRKTLATIAGAPAIVDHEVTPGIESLQVRFGVDVDGDNSVDRYVDPGDPLYDPLAAEFVPEARVITVRVQLGARDPHPDAPAGDVRRVQVSKTVLLRNART